MLKARTWGGRTWGAPRCTGWWAYPVVVEEVGQSGEAQTQRWPTPWKVLARDVCG